MRPSALATFNKLALRNDTGSLERGIYQINVGLHFPVLPYKGRNIYTSPKDRLSEERTTFGDKLDGGWRCLFYIRISLVGDKLCEAKKNRRCEFA